MHVQSIELNELYSIDCTCIHNADLPTIDPWQQ